MPPPPPPTDNSETTSQGDAGNDTPPGKLDNAESNNGDADETVTIQKVTLSDII